MEDLIMVRTLEELKEMIDNTIIENDKGEITATTLNLVLKDMSDSLSAMGGGGGGQFDIYATFEMPEGGDMTIICDEEQKAKNKEVFDKIFAGEISPLVLHINSIENMPVEGCKFNISGICITIGLMYDIPSGLGEEIIGIDTNAALMFFVYGFRMIDLSACVLLPNGDIIMSEI